MYIERLKLKGFRNYDVCDIGFAKNFNILYGDNAQGKTNILESIFLCASGRSHRTAKDSELIKMGDMTYQIKLKFVKNGINSTIDISFAKEEKKKIKVNDIALKKIGNLMGNLNAVIFSPEDLLIIKEGPAERRRFIDITLSQLKPAYFYDLQQYMKILSQRNTLLKEIQINKSLMDTLEIWNNNLIRTGARIIRVRNEFINRLGKYAENNHYKLTDDKEKLEFKYTPSIEAENYDDVRTIERAFLNKLETSLYKELAKCSTLYGPQRDDYEIYLNGMNIKRFGSQGQQRTAILSIKLSEIDIMREETGEYPVLLLDDVMSELDTKRQEYLFKSLTDIQTFITCTDKEFFAEKVFVDSSFFHVSNGETKIED